MGSRRAGGDGQDESWSPDPLNDTAARRRISYLDEPQSPLAPVSGTAAWSSYSTPEPASASSGGYDAEPRSPAPPRAPTWDRAGQDVPLRAIDTDPEPRGGGAGYTPGYLDSVAQAAPTYGGTAPEPDPLTDSGIRRLSYLEGAPGGSGGSPRPDPLDDPLTDPLTDSGIRRLSYLDSSAPRSPVPAEVRPAEAYAGAPARSRPGEADPMWPSSDDERDPLGNGGYAPPIDDTPTRGFGDSGKGPVLGSARTTSVGSARPAYGSSASAPPAPERTGWGRDTGQIPVALTPPPPQPANAPGIVLGAWFLGLAAAIGFWWQNTTELGDTATMLLAAGRVTGLIGGYTLLTQILLASRLPLLQSLGGSERMARWHRDLGALTTIAVLAHAVLLIQGYAMLGETSFWAATLLQLKGPDMLEAFIATGILVAIALLCIRGVRKLLPYEIWHLVHRAAYAVLILGYAHQFTAGQDVYKGFGQLYWIALYLLVITALAWGRIGAPLLLNTRHGLRVAEVVNEGPDVVSIYLTGKHLASLNARAGQYMRWRFMSGGLMWQSHPFSLSAAPNPHWLRITVKAVGGYTARLAELRPGTRVYISYPAGENTAERTVTDRALLIAGGSGIAPIRALLTELPTGTVVVYRAQTEADLVLKGELEEIARNRGGRLVYITGHREDRDPRRLLTSSGLVELVPDVTERDVYLCGPPGFAEAMTDVLRDLRIPNRQLHISAFEL
ncbi:ferredoxin reductase family protein [Virgisporangium aliadipatigenens]|uniref:ferredoxin reductase family protein n=1 Tax=Virgisporangium aliadipatigenens TaxID=741659 RepID=UPI001942E749|nr:ferredoxin reductase family protein [Virgisporangium aliadipatigenens]